MMGIYNYIKSSLFSVFLIFIILVNTRLNEAQWEKQASGTFAELNDVVMIDSSTAYIAGDRTLILKTIDAGKTWNNVFPGIDCGSDTLDCSFNWKRIAFYDSLNLIAVGDGAVITTDGGNNWHFLDYNLLHKLTCVSYIGPGNIYIGDDSGYVYHSVDSGKTWKSEKITDLPIRSIFHGRGIYINGLPVYALTSRSMFYKTEFPPSEWISRGDLGYFHGLGSEALDGGISDDGTLFVVGVQGDFTSIPVIIRLRPMDSRWFSVGSFSYQGDLRGISIPSSKIIYTCGSNGRILKSADGGNSWISLLVPTYNTLNSIYFFNEKNGFAVGEDGTILQTSNGGIPTSNKPPSPFHLSAPANQDTMSLPKSIVFSWQKAVDPDSDKVYYSLLISDDTCSVWKSYGPVTGNELQIQNPVEKQGRYFWTVIATDRMNAVPSLDVFTFNITSVSDAKANDKQIPGIFTLYQNYPNPFNPATMIGYYLPVAGHVTMNVYGILGNSVRTLVDADKPGGKYEIIFNAAGLPSGIYFYRIYYYSISGQRFTSAKKMILIK